MNAIYSATTEHIKVTVLPEPIVNESDPFGGVYVFAYTVSIENVGTEIVQLLERHWQVFSKDVQIGEVVGPGVVGEQPRLEPGQSFEYTSSTLINDPIGYMYGTYTFRSQAGRFFQVEIPKFDLHFPVMVH